ncbi:MAG: matrixin family metalloprotease [archaeon]
MRFIDFLVLFLLFVCLFIGIFFLWESLPTEDFDFEKYYTNLSFDLPQNSSQFYPNMRYVDENIGYAISQNCSQKKQRDFERAVALLESKTILKFFPSDAPELLVSCSNIAPKPEEERHFVAGEGGPTTIINASRYAVIFLGKIALYRPETCETPQIAVHELLHALGFDHNNNSASIMFPYTDCKQTIDQNIIDDINNLYSQSSEGDIVIEDLTANKTGRYLNFEITTANYGLKKITSPKLSLIVGNEIIKTFEIKDLDVGAKRSLNVENLKVPRNAEEITFNIETIEKEISKENNIVKMKVLIS